MHKQRHYLVLLVTLILWASSYTGIKAGLGGYSPFELAAFRFLIASLALACATRWFRVRWPRKQDIPIILTLALVGVASLHAALNYAETRASAGTAAFLVNVAPILIMLIAWRFLGEKITWRGWIGTGVSLVGVWLIAYAQGGTLVIGIDTLVLLGVALCWSLFCILQKPLLKFYTPFEVACYSVWDGSIFLSFSLPHVFLTLPHAPLSATFSAAYLGLFPTALASVTWAYVLARMPASRASVYAYLVPVLSLVIAFAWLGETPSLLFAIGGVAVLGGVAIATIQTTPDQRAGRSATHALSRSQIP